MEKRTLVTTNTESSVVEVKGEHCLRLEFTGLTLTEYTGDCNYSNRKAMVVYIPLTYIPYIMRRQREAVAEFESKQLDLIERIKKAYNTEVQPVK